VRDAAHKLVRDVRGQLHAGKRIAALAALLVACSTPAAAPAAHPTSTPATPTPTPAAAIPAGPCAEATLIPPTPPGLVSAQPVWQLATGLNGPDDLTFFGGRFVVGELHAGRILRLALGLPLERLPMSVPAVEGIGFVHGDMYAADQQDDRVVAVSAGGGVSTLIQLTPVAGQDNVDGIAVQGDELVVPDSPRGVVDWYSTAGTLMRQAGGFVRPTGAWPEADGSLLVADEYGNAAYRVRPDGSKQALVTGLPIVDDVAEDSAGHIFVVTPVVTGGRLAELVDGRAVDLVSRLVAPQGLTTDGADNIAVTEEDAGRVDLVIRSFQLAPVANVHRGERVCLDVVRAPGFTAPVELASGAGVTVVSQPGARSRAEVVLGDCPNGSCELQARSGTLSDELWIAESP
jgi:hypothetical protein